MNLLREIIIPGIIFLTIDSIYLTSLSSYYNELLLKIQGKGIEMKYLGVILCYIFLIYGLYYFILSRNKKDIKKDTLDAFLLGIVIYGVYETTNYAIIDKWDLKTVLIDTVWGGILFSLTTFISIKYII